MVCLQPCLGAASLTIVVVSVRVGVGSCKHWHALLTSSLMYCLSALGALVGSTFVVTGPCLTGETTGAAKEVLIGSGDIVGAPSTVLWA